MFFVKVKWQIINEEGILDLEKVVFCNNHSNNCLRHVSEWKLGPMGEFVEARDIYTVSSIFCGLLSNHKRENCLHSGETR